jgi:hypothetical protein
VGGGSSFTRLEGLAHPSLCLCLSVSFFNFFFSATGREAERNAKRVLSSSQGGLARSIRVSAFAAERHALISAMHLAAVRPVPVVASVDQLHPCVYVARCE